MLDQVGSFGLWNSGEILSNYLMVGLLNVLSRSLVYIGVKCGHT